MGKPGDFPVEGVELTLLLVVSDVVRSVRFYTEVLGASLFREYGGTSAVLQFQGTWILLVTGGGPTPGKPTVTLERSSATLMATSWRSVRSASAAHRRLIVEIEGPVEFARVEVGQGVARSLAIIAADLERHSLRLFLTQDGLKWPSHSKRSTHWAVRAATSSSREASR